MKRIIVALTIVLLFTFVLLQYPLFAVTCFTYGSILSCDTPTGGTVMQAPLSRSGGVQQGVIQNDRGRVEPYTIIRPPSGSSSYSSRPIEPLERLDRLDRLDRMDRRDDNLLFAPLFLGE